MIDWIEFLRLLPFGLLIITIEWGILFALEEKTK